MIRRKLRLQVYDERAGRRVNHRLLVRHLRLGEGGGERRSRGLRALAVGRRLTSGEKDGEDQCQNVVRVDVKPQARFVASRNVIRRRLPAPLSGVSSAVPP